MSKFNVHLFVQRFNPGAHITNNVTNFNNYNNNLQLVNINMQGQGGLLGLGDGLNSEAELNKN